MNILSWNCRGLGRERAVRTLRDLNRTHNPDVIFLMESKQPQKRLERIRKTLKFGKYKYFDREGIGGGTVLWWKEGVDMDILKESKNYFHVVFRKGDYEEWFATFVYGAPRVEDRAAVWNEIVNFNINSEQAWMVIGDFNEIRSQSEKIWGIEVELDQTDRFNSFIDRCELLEIPVQGGEFTWNNNRAGIEFITEKLDRILCNNKWSLQFPQSFGVADIFSTSDHKPLILCLEPRRSRKKKRRFNFESKWLLDERCAGIVQEMWNSNYPSNSSVSFNEKLSATRENLRAWSIEKFRNSKNEIERIRAEILAIQVEPLSVDSKAQLESLNKDLDLHLKMEEMYWHQRSRVKWLFFGDKNTSFFHASTVFNRRRNRINRIITEEGEVLNGERTIKEHICKFFKQSFSSDYRGSNDAVLNMIPSVISELQNNHLIKEVSLEEVKAATFGMGAFKAPGPDGFPGMFYQNFWDTVGFDIYTIVKVFLETGEMPEGLNSTNVVLIPKQKDPEKVSQYRPISLCNFVYKIISKVMATRLKSILPDIINPAQSAFVAGRQIQDNILVAHEVFHALKKRRNQKEGALAIKLDLAKAYDKVEWKFLEELMERMGFHNLWIDRVMRCVSTTTMAIVINGEPSERFKPERGIRQGDPLSPFLFILIANVLSILIEQEKTHGLLEGFKIKEGCPCVDHLLFADDCLLFSYASRENVTSLLNVLQKFQDATGQRVNYSKSSVFFSPNTPISVKVDLLNLLVMSVIEEGSKYLGLPTIWGRGKVEALDFILEKVRSKIEGWKGNLLSQAGREVLMKAVASAIPTYIMQGFYLPKTFCTKLNSLLIKFWWSGPDSEKNSTHWVGWPKMVKAKYEGGLGFRDFTAFNKALLAKQVWRAIKNPNALWVQLLRSLYCKGKDFLEAKKGSNSSWGWQSFMEGIKVLRLGTRWCINNGQNTLIWSDRWLPREPKFTVSTPKPTVFAPQLVNCLIDFSRKKWKEEELQKWFNQEDINAIYSIPIGSEFVEDELIWHFNTDGMYTVKSGYHTILKSEESQIYNSPSSSTGNDKDTWKGIWKLKMLPRIKTFTWRACHNSLPTRENLKKRCKMEYQECSRCGCNVESLEHLMFFCPFAQAVWRCSSVHYTPDERGFPSFATWWRKICEMFHANRSTIYLNLVATICWNLWTSRNELIFEKKKSNPEIIWERSLSLFNQVLEGEMRQPNESDPGAILLEPNRCSTWIAPRENQIKVNCDASWLKNSCNGGFAAIARDSMGRLVSGSAWKGFAKSIRTAEAFAIRSGVELALTHGWNDIIIE